MIIRSQDKKTIVIFENIGQLYIEKDYRSNIKIAVDFPDGRTCELGVYSTEEKAIKVLDMIQENYISCTDQWNGIPCVTNKVFQMPQDNEVTV